jgi:hypothetical protein
MANLCSNVVEITANEELLDEIMEVVNGTGEILEYFAPLEGRSSNEAWGTKWEPEAVVADRYDGYVVIDFDTPWVPAVPAVQEFVERIYKETGKSPSVEGYYMEPSLDFCGYYYNHAHTKFVSEQYEGIAEAPDDVTWRFPNLMLLLALEREKEAHRV